MALAPSGSWPWLWRRRRDWRRRRKGRAAAALSGRSKRSAPRSFAPTSRRSPMAGRFPERRDDARASAARQRRAAEGAGAGAEINAGVRGPFHPRRASQTGNLQDHDLLGRLGRRPRRRRIPASQGLQRRDGMRGRAQERQVRPAFPPACAPVQRRRAATGFRSSSRPTNSVLSPSSRAPLNAGNAASR